MAAVLSSPIQAGQDQTMFELGAAQKKQTSKDFKPAPEEIKTNFGTLKFTGGGYPTTETAQRIYDELDFQSIGRINTLFSFFHQEKKDINDVVQPWGIRNLTDFRRHAQYGSFPPVNPAKFQLPGMPATYRYFCSQQFGELTESN